MIDQCTFSLSCNGLNEIVMFDFLCAVGPDGPVAVRRKIVRPKIIDKREELPDWGDRCIDSFEMIAQIGEGTYGQVYKAKDSISGKHLFTYLSIINYF